MITEVVTGLHPPAGVGEEVVDGVEDLLRETEHQATADLTGRTLRVPVDHRGQKLRRFSKETGSCGRSRLQDQAQHRFQFTCESVNTKSRRDSLTYFRGN